ncbi:exosortase J [Granulicella cerasi]|uniref:Exosortase J n=1 Tax=Granulicella cerasi TaxID=741063 RepID=A0ABW1Z9K7_9BACT|nr:exosortase J [Granulicella cerasi]
MSPASDHSTASGSGLRLPVAAALVAALAVVGVMSVYSTAGYLLGLWATDPLKSIGAFVPLVSFVLILRVWRSLGWEMRGTWWGLVILVVTIALVHLRDHAILELVLSPSKAIFLPPHSLVALAYTSGLVLLFGGTRLYRKAIFPIILMWFVNPVPHTFNLVVDMPLQHASAMIARGFAHAMGQKLTSDQLRLMFTPEFGMFIAPGCNGIRGAITMGFIALVAGYVYRFRPRVIAMMTLGAILLGYIFNLVRLCVLVLYYIVALHITWLQSRAEMGDYIIGACLFFTATLLLFSLIRRFNPTHDLRPPRMPIQPGLRFERAGMSFTARLAAMAVVFLVGSFSYVHTMVAEARHPQPQIDQKALGRFPQQLGQWKLRREWNEYLTAGPLIFYWADYAPADGGPIVSVGISPVLGAHDTLLCHAARGEDWLWHGDLNLPTAGGSIAFSGSFFNDGATQYLEATTVCEGSTCGQHATQGKRFGLVYSRPDLHSMMQDGHGRTMPVLLRTETLDTAMAADRARAELTSNLAQFLSAANLSDFTAPYR